MSNTTLVTRRPCGCVVLVLVNEPGTVSRWAKDITEEIVEDRVPVEMPTEEVRTMPWHCVDHPKGWRNGKPIGPEAETASLWETP